MSGVAANVVWHDVECGGYSADLVLWERLAGERRGPVLDIGCGSGRVALHLARRGHEIQGIDLDPGLVDAFNRRAADLPASAVTGDARAFQLDREFGLAIAPMQFIQLLASPDERIACLSCMRSHLRPGGLVAVAIAEAIEEGESASDGAILPDAQEVDGWLFSSLPLEVAIEGPAIRVRRLRQTVSPAGELDEALNDVTLAVLDSREIEAEASEARLRLAARRTVDPTELHVGSTVLVFEGAA